MMRSNTENSHKRETGMVNNPIQPTPAPLSGWEKSGFQARFGAEGPYRSSVLDWLFYCKSIIAQDGAFLEVG